MKGKTQQRYTLRAEPPTRETFINEWKIIASVFLLLIILINLNCYHGEKLPQKKHGVFSPRPYQLAQACDGSINSCVLALYYRFCKDRQLNPYDLYRQAYDEDSHDINFDEIKQFADWQGVQYPNHWTKKQINGLSLSLTAINFHTLNALISDITESKLII